MVWDEVWVRDAGHGEGVEEEETEDDDDRQEDGVPELPVHAGLDGLLALGKILNGELEGVESPDVEGCEGSGEWEDDKKDDWSSVVWGDGQTGDGVD